MNQMLADSLYVGGGVGILVVVLVVLLIIFFAKRV